MVWYMPIFIIQYFPLDKIWKVWTFWLASQSERKLGSERCFMLTLSESFNHKLSVFCKLYFALIFVSMCLDCVLIPTEVGKSNKFSFNLLVNMITRNFEFVQFRVSVLSLCQICNWNVEFGHNIYFVIITIYSQWLLYIFIWGISLYFITLFLVKTAGLL